MHIKKAQDYQPKAEDQPLFEQVAETIEAVANREDVLRSQKIEVALAALYMFARPYADYPFTPGFVEGITLIDQLSPGGKLELASTLIEQARS